MPVTRLPKAERELLTPLCLAAGADPDQFRGFILVLIPEDASNPATPAEVKTDAPDLETLIGAFRQMADVLEAEG